MKDIIVGILVLIQKLIDKKAFWGIIAFGMILTARPEIIDKFLSNADVTKELIYIAAGGGALGVVMNMNKKDK